MELLLNLLWLSLALPAIWLWRRQRECGRSFQPFHAGLALICALVLLFPAISVSDDLQPMRAEMEDCGVSKRLVRLSVSEWGSPAMHGAGDLPACAAPFFSFHPYSVEAGLAVLPSLLPLNRVAADAFVSRGPPASHLV